MIADKFSMVAELPAKILHAIIAICGAHSEVCMEREPVLRMPRVLRGDAQIPSAPDYGKPEKLSFFRLANGATIEADSERKITDYGGLTVIEYRIGGGASARIFESTSGLLVIVGSMNIKGRVKAFRSAIAELNTFTDWEKADGELDKWQMHMLAGKVRAWLDTLRGI